MPGDAAGLRTANSRLRELLEERDAEIAELRAQLAEFGELREQVAVLQAHLFSRGWRAELEVGDPLP